MARACSSTGRVCGVSCSTTWTLPAPPGPRPCHWQVRYVAWGQTAPSLLHGSLPTLASSPPKSPQGQLMDSQGWFSFTVTRRLLSYNHSPPFLVSTGVCSGSATEFGPGAVAFLQPLSRSKQHMNVPLFYPP